MDGYEVRTEYNTCAANCSTLKYVAGNELLISIILFYAAFLKLCVRL